MRVLIALALPPLRAVILLTIAAAAAVRAEIILSATNGSRVIGESIKFEDEKLLEIEIYRGFSYKVPKSAIARREDVDRSQKPEREAFARRLQGIKERDIAGRLELARWAREQGLTVLSRGLLADLQGRYPRDAGVRAALPAPAFRKTLSEADRSFLRKQVEAFFAPGGKPEEVLATLEGRDALPPGMADEWAQFCLNESRKGVRVKEGDSKFKNGAFECDLHIELRRRPPAKTPEPAGRETGAGDRPATNDAPWPVVVSLHGGGLNDGHWTSGGPMYANLFSRHFDKLILVAPTVMRKNYAEWGANPDEELQLKEILRAVKRTWNVDTDRIYLAGYSMGGYGTWHIGGHQADQFAGLVSGAGGILLGAARGESWGWGIVGNLMHTPIAFQHGGKDAPAPPWSDKECDRILTELAARHPGCYRHLYKFYPESGHGLPESGSAEAVAWVASFRREPYPKKICWEPKRAFNRQFYWLRIEKPRIFTRLEAEIGNNRVSIKTLNINGGFSILLNRHLADLDKPVTVEVDGKRVFEGLVPETLSTILTTVADRIDERQWFSARIDI